MFVRRDLEHRIGARVDDRPAGGEMLGAQLLDDLRAAGRLVPEIPGRSGEPQPLLHQLRRKSVREGGEAFLQHDSDHLPVAGGRVLAAGHLGHGAEAGPRRAGGRAAGDFGQVAETPALQRGQVQATHPPRHVAERIRALVAVGSGVGKRPGAAGVDHQDDETAQWSSGLRKASTLLRARPRQ